MSTRARPAAECDVVMKGGITSGVVYPLAAAELAKDYRFRSVGGSSAGAIAAAAVAAAEFGRSSRGFEKLAELPNEIAPNLVKLFQPSRRTLPLFRVLLAATHPKRRGLVRVVGVVAALIRSRSRAFVLGALFLLVPAFSATVLARGVPTSRADWLWIGRGLLAVLPLAVATGVAGAVAGLILRGWRALPENGYGICSGMSDRRRKRSDVAPLTEWLTDKINDLAGLKRTDPPLSFGDLWGASAVEAFDHLETTAAARDLRSIDLRMMTTNVTHGRPMSLPFETRTFMFCKSDFDKLFPERVVTALTTAGGLARSRANTPWCCPEDGEQLYRFPTGPKLPVVVAARMSLSFPVLLSAVPLYAVDYSRKDPAKRLAAKCWFSDGGISSNFPIHFFDAPWPSRPTFGFSLAPFHDDYPDSPVYFPDYGTGRVPRLRKTHTLAGFVSAILDTMQNWSDEGLSAMPGYQDRIVEIRHTKKQGGMNLAMPDPVVRELAGRGRMAAETLKDKFKWRQHRWSRYLSAMAEIQQATTSMAGYWSTNLSDGSDGYETFIGEAGGIPPVEFHGLKEEYWPMSTDAAAALVAFSGLFSEDFSLVKEAPKPLAELRVSPRY
jgi:predicted acylesterase/phospholipase RssA